MPGAPERRQLTVLFCDLADSTVIAADLGPEDWREMLRAYQESVASVVERFDGHVAQYLGDGVLVYFGFPRAHEDDAERALRAGLGIVEAIAARQFDFEKRYGRGLSIRLGIHSGPVVVGDVGSGERHETLAVGEAANIAARIQERAEPGSVLISDATLHLVRGFFVTVDQGPSRLKGIGVPVHLHRVVQPGDVRSRLDVAASEGLTPFVGREQEVELLLERWARAKEGRGQVVLLSGDAGIGKSRLLQALREYLTPGPNTWLECRASKFQASRAFHPVTELIERQLGMGGEETPESNLERLERGLGAIALEPSEAVPLLADLLDLPLPERYPPLAISPEARRSRTLEALVRWLLALAGRRPVVLVVEDLHWIDPSSLEVFGKLIERASDASILLLPTFRTSFEPPWALDAHVTHLSLDPLTRRETEAMVEGITGGRPLPVVVLDQVVKRTDGVPLFVEEFTRTILESGLLVESGGRFECAAPLPELSVPVTLQDSLMARLDRLGPAKDVAQLAALLGRDFSRELLATISKADDGSLDRGLARLVSAGVLRQHGDSDSPSYTFKHALIQDTAHQSLLKTTRRAWHARIARALEEHFPTRAASEPERLAWHCEQGGLAEKAVSYYRLAGERATQRSANAEAIGHLERGIDQLRMLPAGPGHDGQELVLQVELGTALVATNGWGSPEAERAYARARELCEGNGEPPQIFQAIRGLVTFYTARAELETAHALAGRLLDIAERAGEPPLLLLAHEQLAILHYFLGDPSSALGHFERAIALHQPSQHRRLTHLYGEDLGVFARIWMAWALWLVGHVDQAVERGRQGIELGREASHPFSLAYALLWTSILHVMRREPEPARELAEQAISISEEQGFAFVLGGGRLVRGWTRLDPLPEEHEIGAAVEEFRQCVAQIGQTGTQVNGPMMLGYLAEADRRLGRDEQAMASVEAALSISERTRQTHWNAELLRIKGELVRQRDRSAQGEAEHLFRRALDVARSQKARSLELRAAVSLGDLWQEQGKREDVRTLLAPVHAWFTEGLDTPDLEEAHKLLEATGGP